MIRTHLRLEAGQYASTQLASKRNVRLMLHNTSQYTTLECDLSLIGCNVYLPSMKPRYVQIDLSYPYITARPCCTHQS